MKVFISWSGPKAEAVANALRAWLPRVLQQVKPFLSSKDIQKGADWRTKLMRELEESACGIIVVTPESVKSAWLNYEAGALSIRFDPLGSLVIPLLIGVNDIDQLRLGPLETFQKTYSTRDDILDMVSSLNGQLGEGDRLEKEVLVDTFNKWWRDLESELDRIEKIHVKDEFPRAEKASGQRADQTFEIVRGLQISFADLQAAVSASLQGSSRGDFPSRFSVFAPPSPSIPLDVQLVNRLASVTPPSRQHQLVLRTPVFGPHLDYLSSAFPDGIQLSEAYQYVKDNPIDPTDPVEAFQFIVDELSTLFTYATVG